MFNWFKKVKQYNEVRRFVGDVEQRLQQVEIRIKLINEDLQYVKQEVEFMLQNGK